MRKPDSARKSEVSQTADRIFTARDQPRRGGDRRVDTPSERRALLDETLLARRKRRAEPRTRARSAWRPPSGRTRAAGWLRKAGYVSTFRGDGGSARVARPSRTTFRDRPSLGRTGTSADVGSLASFESSDAVLEADAVVRPCEVGLARASALKSSKPATTMVLCVAARGIRRTVPGLWSRLPFHLGCLSSAVVVTPAGSTRW